MTWFAWIIALVAPIVKKVLIALGVGIVTYSGFDAFISSIQGYINTQIGGMTADIASTLSLVGAPDMIGVMLGAYSGSIALTQAKRFQII